jgi:hypothetical protein
MNGARPSSTGLVYGWIISYPDELKKWRRGGTITHLHILKSGKDDTAYVGWFDASDSAAVHREN